MKGEEWWRAAARACFHSCRAVAVDMARAINRRSVAALLVADTGGHVVMAAVYVERMWQRRQ